jgi:hypothetical protein
MARELMLSHHNTGGELSGRQRSLKNICSQNNSIVLRAMDLYSASVLDRDTTACFLAFQETKQLPGHTPKSDVERRSYRLPVQSESQNA